MNTTTTQNNELVTLEMWQAKCDFIALFTALAWADGYVPTLLLERKRGKLHTPSAASVEEVIEMRTIAVKCGRGYYDGRQHVSELSKVSDFRAY